MYSKCLDTWHNFIWVKQNFIQTDLEEISIYMQIIMLYQLVNLLSMLKKKEKKKRRKQNKTNKQLTNRIVRTIKKTGFFDPFSHQKYLIEN